MKKAKKRGPEKPPAVPALPAFLWVVLLVLAAPGLMTAQPPEWQVREAYFPKASSWPVITARAERVIVETRPGFPTRFPEGGDSEPVSGPPERIRVLCGALIGFCPLSPKYGILEAIWQDYGSGSSGDHNLHLIDLSTFTVLGGVHQGGTHSLNADFFWQPESGILYLKAAGSCEETSHQIAVLSPEGASSRVLLSEAFREKYRTVFRNGLPFVERFFLSPSGVSFQRFSEQNGDPIATYSLFWKDIPGCGSKTVGKEWIKRIPETLESASFPYAWKEAAKGESISPNWILLDSHKQEVPLPVSVSQAGFFDGCIWFCGEGGMYWADVAGFRKRRIQKVPVANVRHAQQIGNGHFLVTTPRKILALNLKKGVITHIRPRWSRRKGYSYLAAWKTPSGDLLLAEQTKSWQCGEIGRLWLVRGLVFHE